MRQVVSGYDVRDELHDRAHVEAPERWDMDAYGPALSDEVDEQAWLTDRSLTVPQGKVREPATAPCWGYKDYVEMSCGNGKVCVASGNSGEFRMPKASAPIDVRNTPDPWNLRGGRMAPEATVRSVEAVLSVANVGELLAVSDANLGAARSVLEASDGVLDRLEMAAGWRSGRKFDPEDEEDEKAPPPLVRKPGEPPFRPNYDDWGFPINNPPPPKPAAGSEPSQPNAEPAPKEPGASPLSGELELDGSAAAVSQGAGSAPIKEGGMNTRVQLTEYFNGDYVYAGNCEVDGASPDDVFAVLSVIRDVAGTKHRSAVERGSARPKGGRKVRIQLQPKPTLLVDGKKVKGEPEKGAGYRNLSIPGMELSCVKLLVLRQLKLNFGVSEGEPAKLAKAWDNFMKDEVVVKEPSAPAEEIKEPSALEKGTCGPIGGLPARGDFRGLVGRTYSRRLHLGLFAVVSDNLRVESLWEDEASAIGAASGRRIVDKDGYMVTTEQPRA